MAQEPYFSSSAPKHFNLDGSRNVYCSRCRRLVGTNTTAVNFGSVSACALCLAAEQGIELTPEQARDLRTVRARDGLLLPESVVFHQQQRAEEAEKQDPMQLNPEQKLGPTYYLKAATLKAVESIRDRLLGKNLPSQQLAKVKKRKPIFSRDIEEEVKDE